MSQYQNVERMSGRRDIFIAGERETDQLKSMMFFKLNFSLDVFMDRSMGFSLEVIQNLLPFAFFWDDLFTSHSCLQPW